MQNEPNQNNSKPSYLAKHLTWVIILKIVLLMLIWLFFIRGQSIKLDIQKVAEHIVASAASTTHTSRSAGVVP
ncbi:MAG: cytochrome oxidase putative small subunit CydP [Methylophilus sp.]